MTSKNLAVDALIAQLENGDEVDRCYAAQALGSFQDVRALEPLYRHLQDEDLDVCIDSATALGSIRSEDAEQGLIDALFYHSEVDVKQAAINGLSTCGGSRAAATLLQLLERPEDLQLNQTEGWDDWWDLQRQAVKALGENAAAEAAPALASLLDSDEGQDIESETLKALVQIGVAGIAQLSQRVDTAPPRRLRRIATALAQSSSAEAAALLATLRGNTDVHVRAAATDSLALGSDPQRLSTLVGLLNDPSPEVQNSALKGLDKLKPSASDGLDDGLLQQLLDSPDSRVRCAALGMVSQRLVSSPGLADQGFPEDLLDHLQSGLRSNNAEEQRLCCELATNTDQASIRDCLFDLLQDPETAVQVRRQAIQSIGSHGLSDIATLEALWNSSKDVDGALRHVSLQALQALQSQGEAGAARPSESESNLPTPMALLLSALSGTAFEWPEDAQTDADVCTDEVVTRSLDPQQIALVAVDEQGDLVAPAAALSAPTAPTIEQILASVSDAYPAVQDDAAETLNIGSTLESISRSHIEATVGVSQVLSSDSERILGLVDAMPQEFDEFAQVVHTNARSGERMILEKRRKPEEIDADRRILAARVLGDCAQPEVVAALIGCLMDEDASLRREAADSLGRLAASHPELSGLENSLGPIATQLRAGNEEIRMACARTLGALQHKAAIPALLAALDDPDTLVRIQAIRSLTAIALGRGKALSAADHVVLSEVTPDRITRAILDCQADPEIGVRKAVIDALVALRSLDLELLLKLGLEEGGALTPAAGQALKDLAPDMATEKLIAALAGNDNSAIRRLAMQMLQQIHTVRVA